MFLSALILLVWLINAYRADIECPKIDKHMKFVKISRTIDLQEYEDFPHGIHAIFSNSTKHINRETFSTFDSYLIVGLTLKNLSIESIDDHTFIAFRCLVDLDLSFNKLDMLSASALAGLQNLVMFNLRNNYIQEVPDQAFAQMSKLVSLDLSGNKINNVQPYGFENLTQLASLNLGHNYLSLIAFSPASLRLLSNLQVLNLEHNHFYGIDVDAWLGLDSLTVLNLAGNHLSSFSTGNVVFGDLQVLNISSNGLTWIDVNELSKSMPELRHIDLNDNNWFCVDLMNICDRLKQLYTFLIVDKSWRSLPPDDSVNGIACKGGQNTEITNDMHTNTRLRDKIDKSLIDSTLLQLMDKQNEIYNLLLQVYHSNDDILKMFWVLFVSMIMYVVYRFFIKELCFANLLRTIYSRWGNRHFSNLSEGSEYINLMPH